MRPASVGVETPTGYKLVSWFDVMTDDLFAKYADRGLPSRSSAIISRTDRDADRLTCDGETFMGTGTLPNWITLR